MREKLRRLIGNLALLSFSLLFFYVVFGSLLLRYGPPFFLTIDHVFPLEANLWWQHSAPDPDKNDYIALLGDSLAKGIGDWRAQRTQLDEPYHSADVIHAITGKNILSFGHGGIGSADGFVLMPALALSADRCLIFPKPRKPTEVIYYFYEGNDLNNNLGFIAKALRLDRNSADVQSAAKRLFESWRKPGFLSCSTYFFKVIEAFVQIALPIAKRRGALSRLDPKVINHLLVNDTEVTAPGRLQGPALELSDHDTELAFEVFDASLEWFQRANPDIKVMIVDIPSVLTNYHFARPTVTIQTYQIAEAHRGNGFAIADESRESGGGEVADDGREHQQVESFAAETILCVGGKARDPLCRRSTGHAGSGVSCSHSRAARLVAPQQDRLHAPGRDGRGGVAGRHIPLDLR